jgi:hypothetical protein
VTRRLSATLLACFAVPAAILAGCGGSSSNVDVGPAAAVPSNAALYLDATLKPTGTAKTDAEQALGTVLKTNDPGGKITSLIDQQKTATGQPVNYQTDIAPWLGQKAGVFFTTLGVASTGSSVIETTNPASALAFAKKAEGTSGAPKTVDGVTYQIAQDGKTAYGTDGDFLLVGNEPGVQAAIKAKQGDSLGDSSDFKDALGNLPSDRLGTFYTVPKNFIDALGPAQFPPQSKALIEKTAGDQLDNPVSGSLSATSSSFNLDFVGGKSVSTPQSTVLGDVPSTAWLAVGIGNLGDLVKRELEQFKSQIPNFDAVSQQIQATTGSSLDDLEGSLGDAAIYVQGESRNSIGGALVVQTNKPDLTGRLIGQFLSLARLGAPAGAIKPLQLSGGGTGYQINDRSIASQIVEIAQQGNKIVIGVGAGSAQQALSPATKLADSQPFTTASGQVSSLGTDFFLDFPKVLQYAEATGATKSPGFQQAKPYLDALSYLVTGSGSKGDQAEVKAVLGLNTNSK